MFRINLLDSHALVLTPRWTEFAGPLQAGLMLLVCLLPLALIFWLYSYELKLVAGRTALGLLCLRVATVALILFLVCLEPIYAHTSTRAIPGRVLVTIDRSDSTSIADPQREPIDKLRLARALQLGNDLCSETQLDDWIHQYASGGKLQWVKAEEFPDPAKREEATRDRKRIHDEVCKRVDGMTRSAVVQRLLAPEGGDLLARLTAKHECTLLGFARGTRNVTPEQWRDLFAPVQVPEDKSQKEEKTDLLTTSTDLNLPLLQALERSSLQGGKILGVVLVTDGQHNFPESPVRKAIELGQQKVPVYPIMLGARKPPADIAVIAISGPTATFKNVDATLDVRFKVTGLAAQPLRVRLHKPGQENTPLEERTVQHDGTDREYTERFQTRMEEVGTQKLQVTVRPQQEQGTEATTQNNSQSHVMNVADDKAKVLVIDGEARWEFHYLASVLQRDPTMKVESVVFVQPRLHLVKEDELVQAGNPARELPTAQDAYSAYDCIILGDVTPEQLPPAERVRLEKYVADQGGTLVILAGKRAMPLGFPLDGASGSANGENQDPLMRLLPVEKPQVYRPEDGFAVTLTEEGRQTSYLELESGPGKNEQRWSEFPPHYWGVIGKAKPGATVLASVAGANNNRSAREQRELEQSQALFVRQHYGFGRVLFVGIDSTWRWRYREGDTFHHRFWGQTIRWAASDKPLVTGNDYVRFGTSEAIQRGADPVKVIVRLGDGLLTLPAKLDARARILRLDGKAEEVVALANLSRSEKQARVLETQVANLPPGEYAIELLIPELGDKLLAPAGADGQSRPMRAHFTVAVPDRGEMIELGSNLPLLQEIATKNGTNKVYTPENAAELIDLLTRQAVTFTEQTETRLWQWWMTLVLLVTLLTAEWVIRKWVGLP